MFIASEAIKKAVKPITEPTCEPELANFYGGYVWGVYSE